MENRRNFLVLFFIVVICIFISGCGLLNGTDQEEPEMEDLVQTSVAQTFSAIEEPEEVIEATTEVPFTPSATTTVALPTTITPTPTQSIPQVKVDVDTNCRVGPGEVYDIVGGLLVGETGEVVGRYEDGNYWIINNPDRSGECWIWGYYATVEGPLDELPYFTQPPTPTPTITPTHTITPTFTLTSTPAVSWTGNWSTRFAGFDITVALNQSGSNVTGSFTAWAISYSMNGTLSGDKMTLTGTYTDTVETYPFLFHIVSPNQFNGNGGSGPNEWCGYRSGAGLPSPCMYP